MKRNVIRIVNGLLKNPRGAIKYGNALIAYYTPSGFAPAPRTVHFHVTHKCNLRCKMCWYWGQSGIKPITQELSAQEIKSLIHQISRFRPYICISGGEPLTRKDIIEVLEDAKKHGLKCELLTNGTLITPEIAQELANTLDSLILSIDGSAKIHDSIRGEGAFDKVIRGIKLVHKAKETVSNKITIRINLTISSINFISLDKVVDIAHDLDCALSFSHLVFSDKKTAHDQIQFLRGNLSIEDNTSESFITNLHDIDVVNLIENIRISKDKAISQKVPFHIGPMLKSDKEVQEWYLTINPIQDMHCTYPWTTLYIKPDGEVQPCEFINYSLGNVRVQDVTEIWNGARARKFRRTLRKGEFPGCRRCCKLTPKPLL